MASIVPVDDPDDPRLADYVSLRDVQLRTSLEARRGLFVAEGEKVVRRSVEAGLIPRSFLMTQRWLSGLADVLDAVDAPCYLVSEGLAERVTGFHVHRGALASVARPEPRSLDDVLAGARHVVVLEDVVDHANVGAVIRSAAALGMDAALLSPRCADPLYRRSVKVAMGAVFSLPWTRLTDWHDAVALLSARGYTCVALTPDGAAEDLSSVAARLAGVATAILIGTEGQGLSPRWLAAADIRARIPMSLGVDSLNVAAATAVACYALTAAVRADEGPDMAISGH